MPMREPEAATISDFVTQEIVRRLDRICSRSVLSCEPGKLFVYHDHETYQWRFSYRVEVKPKILEVSQSVATQLTQSIRHPGPSLADLVCRDLESKLGWSLDQEAWTRRVSIKAYNLISKQIQERAAAYFEAFSNDKDPRKVFRAFIREIQADVIEWRKTAPPPLPAQVLSGRNLPVPLVGGAGADGVLMITPETTYGTDPTFVASDAVVVGELAPEPAIVGTPGQVLEIQFDPSAMPPVMSLGDGIYQSADGSYTLRADDGVLVGRLIETRSDGGIRFQMLGNDAPALGPSRRLLQINLPGAAPVDVGKAVFSGPGAAFNLDSGYEVGRVVEFVSSGVFIIETQATLDRWWEDYPGAIDVTPLEGAP